MVTLDTTQTNQAQLATLTSNSTTTQTNNSVIQRIRNAISNFTSNFSTQNTTAEQKRTKTKMTAEQKVIAGKELNFADIFELSIGL
ncbi:hypothetical protein AB751O23_CP_00030 [Chlamydiales bacterium SCGC AB-751-O23]|jgi:hypothetical protein|nr:hypothetical protein AB751O23_CP_00030 [Chlamydiales bacterium SCGC AB-751-O23]